ncbi:MULTISPECIES: carboxymuconolactone decarboxylase family protein [Anaeromyxobacter]|uniref:carboxymuconolactone decarboxylase family protein n=1 Tax=Anaeromyxobacter TaxID=161492 RepID=UPI001F5827F1|nr:MULTISPECIES: carboxymuconolactone decarboxylase family protein [unclassified Anaeromyxobacter]
MADVKAIHDEVKQLFGLVPTWVKEMPESAVTGFWTLMRDFQLAETRIPNKYKELMGLAVAGATRCRYCALFHTEAARMFGATDEEIAEASMMSAATMAGSTFLNAQQTDYDTFARELREMLEYIRAHQPAAAAATSATQQQPPMQH